MTERDRTNELVRSFVCIEIPDSIKSRIGKLQDRLRKAEAQVSWTKPANVHLTIKFLGNVEVSRIQPISRALESAAEGIAQFELEVEGAGCFPSAKRPRVFWIGIASIPEPLGRLHKAIEDGLARAGFEPEKRRFSPHLTIGRVRDHRNLERAADLLIEGGFESETFTAKEVVLMRSDLKPTGSIYTPQSVIKLT